MNHTRLRTVADISAETVNPDTGRRALPENTLYEWIARAEENGIGRAVVRIGRKVLIDIDEFNAWLDSRRVARAAVRPSARAAAGRDPARSARTA